MGTDFELERDRARIVALARALDRPVSSEAVELLGRYVALVATWNRKLDLTGARDAAAQVEVLLADALVLADPALVPPASRLLDVGSGAGAPVLPVLLLRPDVSALLVEPLRKRVAFLRTALGSLALVNRVQVLEAKLDADAPAIAGAPFDVATSRATFAPALWLEVGAKLARRTLVLLAAQEPPPPPAGKLLAHLVRYRLPSNSAERCIAVYDAS